MALSKIKVNLLQLTLALGLALTTSGCWESESEYNKIVAEKEALSAELEAAKIENNVLASSLNEIYQERDRLLTQIKTLEDASLSLGGGPASQGTRASGEASTENAARLTGEVSVYTVQSGDSLTGIAARHKVTLEELRAANSDLPGEVIHTGQKLNIPLKSR